MSDVHINHLADSRTIVFQHALATMERLSPVLTFMTGDLADDFSRPHHPCYGTQSRADNDIYYNMTSQYDRSVFIEVAGNRDEYGVFSVDSPSHHFYAHHPDDPFFFRNVSLTLKSGTIAHFLLVNPFSYSSAHPPLVFWATPSSSLIRDVDSFLKSIPPEDIAIFLCHYPLHMQLPAAMRTTVAGSTARFAIAGHVHPSSPIYVHHGATLLEVIGTDLLEDHGSGLFTFDNDRFVYNHVPPNWHLVFVTNPVLAGQLTFQKVFNEHAKEKETGTSRKRATGGRREEKATGTRMKRVRATGREGAGKRRRREPE
jgi:hypothetical protein